MKAPNFPGSGLIALSGGADSVALLLLAKEAGVEIAAAHMEHGIRGADSVGDMRFCEELCEMEGVKLYIARADVPRLARERGEGLEAVARRERYEFLRRVKSEAGLKYIYTAHHLDDQAETVLMHVLRGGGVRGAAGMREISRDIARPLLGIRKAELVEYLASRGVGYRNDQTNFSECTPRNILRISALPAMERAYPGCVSALGRFARQAAIECDFMDSLAAKITRRELCGFSVDEGAEEAVVRHALASRVFSMEGVELALKSHAASLPEGLKSEKYAGRIYITTRRAEDICQAALAEEFGISLCAVRARPAEPVPVRDNPMAQVFDARAIQGAVLRVRKEGDYIKPLGMSGRKSLSDYMTDKKLPRPNRDFWPVLAVGSEVMWVIGAGVSETSKARDGECARLDAEIIL